MSEELHREVVVLSQRVAKTEGDLSVVASRMRDIELQNASVEAHKANVEFRLKGIEDSLKWVVRLIIGAILLGLIGFALGGGLVLV